MNPQLALQAMFTCEVDAVAMGHGVSAAKMPEENPMQIHSCESRFEIIVLLGVLAPGMLIVAGR